MRTSLLLSRLRHGRHRYYSSPLSSHISQIHTSSDTDDQKLRENKLTDCENTRRHNILYDRGFSAYRILLTSNSASSGGAPVAKFVVPSSYRCLHRLGFTRNFITRPKKIEKIEVVDHGQRAVTTALWRNFLVFTLKFGVWMSTSSHVILAEMVHSLADFTNQALLAYGLSSSLRVPEALHPYGYSKERFVWSLISAKIKNFSCFLFYPLLHFGVASWCNHYTETPSRNRTQQFQISGDCKIPTPNSPTGGDMTTQEDLSKLNEEVARLKNLVEEIKGGQSGTAETNISGKSNDGIKTSDISEDPIDIQRREKVKDAMIHAWSSYEKYAWGNDELQPQSKSGVNSFGGLGATLIDGLDTLYIMGLDEQFKNARSWVAESLDFNKDYDASVFETTIRLLYKVVGGLLSTYDLSGDKIFLEKAKDIADRLLPAWDTPSGIPYNIINLAHGNPHNPGWTGGDSILADSGTEQLEFIALSQRTGDSKYQQKVENVILELNKTFPDDGLLPIYINPSGGSRSYSTITFGAMGDSFYEYLLKVWIQGKKTSAVKHYREMWEKSMKGLLTLVRRSTPSSYAYLCEKIGTSLTDKMDELACFAPGMLALGASGYDRDEAQKFLSLAEELARTCYNFYQSTPTKLAGENYYFRSGEDMSVGTSWNILRPETVESLFYLWRLTGNARYKDWGWDIFQAFEKNSRIDTGYVGLKDVNTGVKDDMMQSFFLAETLKYLYLLFSPSSVISLDEWVFNTEAHPIKIIARHDQIEDSRVSKGKPKIKTRVRKEGRFGEY